MIKPASFQEEYFVVLTLQGKVKKIASRLQNLVADHFNLFEPGEYPELHITIDRINKNKVNLARKKIKEIAVKSPAIKIKISELVCLEETEDRQFLVLNVDKTDSLVSLADEVHTVLEKENISTIKNYEDWNYHITIVNNNLAKNPIPEGDFRNLCLFIEGSDTSSSSYANNIEIWRPILDPDLKLVESIKLPNGSEEV